MALITANDIVVIGFKEDEGIDSSHFTDVYIETIEKVYLRPYFPQVYDNIIAKSASEYTDNEALLVDKIKTPLVLFCKHDIVPELSIGLNNAGAQNYSSDYTTPVSSAERVSLQSTIMRHAEAEMDAVNRWYVEQDDLTGEETEDSSNQNGDIIF